MFAQIMDFLPSLSYLLQFLNVALASILTILAFSLLAYTLTYNFRDSVARRFALLLLCVMITYASDVALARVLSAESANRWLRLQWVGIAFLPAAYYLFSLSVLRATNYRVKRKRYIGFAAAALSVISALGALFDLGLLGSVHYTPPFSYLESGPYFWFFALFYTAGTALAFANIWRARERCLTDTSRQRMTYLLAALAAPAIGIFPYLVGAISLAMSELPVLILTIFGNIVVAMALVVMSYSVAYFGVLTPDRVVRYRLIRFFVRGPVVAILVILAILTLPRVEQLIGLPRDMVLFTVITGVIVLSQLLLSVTKSIVDRLVYREDREEIAWLRELDRRLLATSDLRQFLEHNLVALCELLRVPSGFIAIITGPDLMLEVMIGPESTYREIVAVEDWNEALAQAIHSEQTARQWDRPVSHAGYWVWPLLYNGDETTPAQTLGILGIRARTETPILNQDEVEVLDRILENVARALMDRQLQQNVFVALRGIIPDIERIQQMRYAALPYQAADSELTPASAILNPSPIHSPEFEAWVKDALSHYWGGPRLTQSPLVQLRVVVDALHQADGNPTKALRLVLGQAIANLRPDGKQNLSAPEWLLYNILEMRFIKGLKVREIADQLAISESDLYRKQRVAIGQVARVLSEMEQNNGHENNGEEDGNGEDTGAQDANASSRDREPAERPDAEQKSLRTQAPPGLSSPADRDAAHPQADVSRLQSRQS
ncbi:MAG: histidine kinase N-terminal 7TM domain-containing protein [Litorilinea sp.]